MEITTTPNRKLLKDMLMQKMIEKQDIFIFVATPYSMKNKDRPHHCAVAAKFSKTMYAVVKRGLLSRIYWRRYKHFPWKTVYFFKTDEDLDYIINELLKTSERAAKRRNKRKKEDQENIGYA